MRVDFDPEQDSRTFVPAPAGMHTGVLVDVIDEGLKEQTWEGRTRMVPKLKLVWQLPIEIPGSAESEYGARRFTVSKQYTVSLHEKAALRKDLESWSGKPFGDGKMSVDLDGLIGDCALLQVQHKQGQWRGKPTTYANVTAVLPATDRVVAEDYLRVKDRREKTDEPESDYSNLQQPSDKVEDDDVPF